MKTHKKNCHRTLRFDKVKRVKMYRIAKGQYRLIGTGRFGNDYHLVEIELTDEKVEV